MAAAEKCTKVNVKQMTVPSIALASCVNEHKENLIVVVGFSFVCGYHEKIPLAEQKFFTLKYDTRIFYVIEVMKRI